MRIPVLTYHAVNIHGNDYASNDHVAFAEDLRLIDRLGLRVVPLRWVVDQHLGLADRDLSRCVALTCDDGSDFDFRDLEHPAHGLQRSLAGCMDDFVNERGAAAQPHLELTSFVIASAEARADIDRGSLVGQGWMREDWWRDARARHRIAIENHGWDHNHPNVTAPGVDGMARGTFFTVDNHVRASAQIAAAADYIDARIAPSRTTIFCYPFGHVPDYLPREYFPHHMAEHRMQAAMGDGAQPVTRDSDRWNLPRYICGWHWRSPEALEVILREAA